MDGFAVATVISTALAGAGAQSFIEGSEDLPLAPVLEAVDEAGMVFDSPSGRIVEAFATGDTDRQEVLAFMLKHCPRWDGNNWPTAGTGARANDWPSTFSAPTAR